MRTRTFVVIGLLATLAFAILYLAATLGLGALAGDVTGENIGRFLAIVLDKTVQSAPRINGRIAADG